MTNIKKSITAQESAYDKDGCIDLILFEEKEHENRIYWLKEQGGKNLLVQYLVDANCVIDELPEDYVIRGCKYHNNKLLLADGNGTNRAYVRQSEKRLFKPLQRSSARVVDMYPHTPMRG